MSNELSSAEDGFASYVLQLATLQLITRSAPFTHVRTLPLHIFSDLLRDYLQLLAAAAKDTAEQAGRTKISVWDVGRALDELGTSSMADLKDDLDQNHGDSQESQKIRTMAENLQDYLDRSVREPVLHLTFDGLAPQELALLGANSQPLASPSILSSDTDDSEARSPSPTSPSSAVQIKDESQVSLSLFDEFPVTESKVASPGKIIEHDVHENGGLSDQNDDGQPASFYSLWRDPSLIPQYIPDFLPPFPGQERESDFASSARRKREREREREREHEREREWDERGRGRGNRLAEEAPFAEPASAVNAWLTPTTYAVSSMGGVANAPHPPPHFQRPSKKKKNLRRKRSLSPSGTSTSLPFYLHTTPDIPHPPTYMRPNAKRRIVASNIALSASFSISLDSWFGSIPMPLTRSAVLTPGFLPDLAPSRIHPFNTSLPHTIATPVPPHPSPHGPLVAVPPHPRLPQTIPSVTAALGQPSSPHLQLFSRLTRSGPPGPLGPNGEALEYEYVGSTALLASNVDWALRPARMSIRERKDDSGQANTGIKLSLKINRDGSASAQGSPAPTPSYSTAGTPAPNAQGFGSVGFPSMGGIGNNEGGLVFSPTFILDPQEGIQTLQRNGSVALSASGDVVEEAQIDQKQSSPSLRRSATKEMSTEYPEHPFTNGAITFDSLPDLPPV